MNHCRVLSVDVGKKICIENDFTWVRRYISNLDSEEVEFWVPLHITENPASTAQGGTMPGVCLHYVVAQITIHTKRIVIYDSSQSVFGETTAWLRSKLSMFGDALRPDNSHGSWHFTRYNCPQQTNGSDCGLHVVATGANNWLGTPLTVRAVHQYRRILPVLIIAVCYDDIMQAARLANDNDILHVANTMDEPPAPPPFMPWMQSPVPQHTDLTFEINENVVIPLPPASVEIAPPISAPLSNPLHNFERNTRTRANRVIAQGLQTHATNEQQMQPVNRTLDFPLPPPAISSPLPQFE
jgi:hypothetical protein